MSAWKELLINILRLTDEVKRLNQTIERLQTHVIEVDKRVVRLETLVEITKFQKIAPPLLEEK